MMDKLHVHMCFHIASNKSTARNKTKHLLRPFLISTSCFLILAEAFRNDYIAASCTALHSATAEIEMGGYKRRSVFDHKDTA